MVSWITFLFSVVEAWWKFMSSTPKHKQETSSLVWFQRLPLNSQGATCYQHWRKCSTTWGSKETHIEDVKSLQFQKTTTTFLIECNKHVKKHVMSIFTPACFCCFLWSVETDGNPSSYQIESYSAAAVTSQSRINKAKTLANHPPVVWRKSFGVFGVWRLVSTKKHWQNIRSINNTHLDIWESIFYFSSTSTLIWIL